MSMHCPHCRLANPALTRFCTSCGAVLVESTPDGGRRRVLRPWGLRNIAPLTEAPTLTDAEARKATRARRRAAREGALASGRRTPLMLGAGLVAFALAGMLIYPYANADERTSVRADPIDLVTLPSLSAIRETKLLAPPLVELRIERKPVATRTARVEVAAKPVANERAPLHNEPSTQAPAPVERSPPAPLPQTAPPVDRWQQVREALAACGAHGGILDRALCEQSVRLASCDSYWGHVALCPGARRDQGQ